MCELSGKTTKRRIGYKVLAYKNGKFYSTFTGQQIKIGKVPMPPMICNRISRNWNSDLDDTYLKKLPFYNKDFVGKTSAFIKLYAAKSLFHDITTEVIFNDMDIVLTKITFDNITYTGKYGICNDPIIASDTIKSIEIIKSN